MNTEEKKTLTAWQITAILLVWSALFGIGGFGAATLSYKPNPYPVLGHICDPIALDEMQRLGNVIHMCVKDEGKYRWKPMDMRVPKKVPAPRGH